MSTLSYCSRRLRVLPYLLEVSAHGFSRIISAALPNRLQNSAVVKLPSFGSTLHLEDPKSLFAQHTHDRINQRKNQGITRSLSQRQVEVEIGFDKRFGF